MFVEHEKKTFFS